MGMLKFYCNMANQNKIKTADHARDKFSSVFILCKTILMVLFNKYTFDFYAILLF